VPKRIERDADGDNKIASLCYQIVRNRKDAHCVLPERLRARHNAEAANVHAIGEDLVPAGNASGADHQIACARGQLDVHSIPTIGNVANPIAEEFALG
jgi:hypothetical protein